VIRALRKLTAGQRIDSHRSEQLLMGLAALPAHAFARPHLGAAHKFTAYDAAYLALAEATNSVLYTSDEELCKGHGARVVLCT
jgi:predicted nucleic acid-binding protein